MPTLTVQAPAAFTGGWDIPPCRSSEAACFRTGISVESPGVSASPRWTPTFTVWCHFQWLPMVALSYCKLMVKTCLFLQRYKKKNSLTQTLIKNVTLLTQRAVFFVVLMARGIWWLKSLTCDNQTTPGQGPALWPCLTCPPAQQLEMDRFNREKAKEISA